MNYLRQYPWFSAALMLLGFVLAAEIAFICERRQAARRAGLQLERRRRELNRVARIVPAPTPENAAAIEAGRADAEHVLVATEAALAGGSTRGPLVPPANRTEMFFDLATFVEKTRERAGKLGVGLGPEEHFGFSAYANEGPEAALIPVVHRQRVVVEHLMDALLRARPQRLLAIERERPDHDAAPKTRPAAPDNRSVPRDLFAIDPGVSARVPGLIDAQAFRLMFLGHTATLRAFLNQLGRFELPVLVRGIEVEPATAEQRRTEIPVTTAHAGEAADRPSPGPLVMPVLSKFTVTVECIGLDRAKANPAAEASGRLAAGVP